MANDTKTPVVGAGTEQPVAAPQPAQSGQPADAAGQQATPETQEKQYVTTDQLEQMRKDTLSTVQSMVNKGENRIKERMQEFEKSLTDIKAAGQQFTPEQEKELRAQALTKAITETPSAPETVPGQPVQSSQPVQDTSPIAQEAIQIQTNYGVTLEDGDPEVATIVKDKGAYAFLRSVEAAAKAKKDRAASPPTITQPETPGVPQGRIPIPGAPTHGLPEEMPAREAWKAVEHKQ